MVDGLSNFRIFIWLSWMNGQSYLILMKKDLEVKGVILKKTKEEG